MNVFRFNITKTTRVSALSTLLALGMSSASAASFSFSQTGYAEGAEISGSFSAVDVNSDGWFTYFPLSFDTDEVMDFSVSFSGNSMVEAFSFGLADLQEFSFFMMGDNLLGNDFSSDPFSGGTEGMSVFDFNYGYFTGQASNFMDGGTVQNFNSGGFSDAPMAVVVEREDDPARVPDSGSAATLLIAGLAGVALIRSKFTRRAAAE